jgi:hypothetical protein
MIGKHAVDTATLSPFDTITAIDAIDIDGDAAGLSHSLGLVSPRQPLRSLSGSALALDALATSLESDHVRALAVRGIVLVRWLPDSRPDEYPPLARFIVDAAERAAGEVTLVSSIAPTRAPPSVGLFEAILGFARTIRGRVDVTYFVLEGAGGFWQTVVRSVTTRVMAAARMRDVVVYVDSYDVALMRACAPRGIDPFVLQRIAERDGLSVVSAAEQSTP